MSHEYANPGMEPVPINPQPVPPTKLEHYTLSDLYADIGRMLGSNQTTQVEVRVGGNSGAPDLSLVRHFDESGDKPIFVLVIE